MIHPDPNKRINASDALKHQWIINHSVQGETEKVIHVTSRPSLSPSSESLRPRTLSRAESESILRIGPAISSIPPSNSPMPILNKILHANQTPDASITPIHSTSNTHANSIGLTLADVCNKLAPLVNELQQQRKRRRAHSHGEKTCLLSSRRICSVDNQSKKKRIAHAKKKVCMDLDVLNTSPIFVHKERRFKSPILVYGPLLPHHQSKRSA